MKIKEYLNNFLKHKKEYDLKESKYIIYTSPFRIFLFISIAIVFVVLFQNNFDKANHIYVKCETQNNEPCFNSLYLNTECYKFFGYNNSLCNTEMLPNGYVFGNPPPKVLSFFPVIVVMVFIILLVINHLLFNKGFKFNVMDDESDKDNK